MKRLALLAPMALTAGLLISLPCLASSSVDVSSTSLLSGTHGSYAYNLGNLALSAGFDVSEFSLSSHLTGPGDGEALNLGLLAYSLSPGLAATWSFKPTGATPYVTLAGGLILPHVKVTLNATDGTTPDSAVVKEQAAIDRAISDILGKSHFGFAKAAFGARAPLTPDLALSLELGYRIVAGTTTIVGSDDDYALLDKDVKETISGTMGGSYASLGLSIRF